MTYAIGKQDSDSVNLGSNPSPPANRNHRDFLFVSSFSQLRKIRKTRNRRGTAGAQESAQRDRSAFWFYCRQAAGSAQYRSKRRGLPCNIDAYVIDELLVGQNFRCAVSGIELTEPTGGAPAKRYPFGPSLDRIVPADGYVRGNVRVVCNMVNCAMNEWGLTNLEKLVEAMTPLLPPQPPERTSKWQD